MPPSHQQRHRNAAEANLTKEKDGSKEEFAALVGDRLLAVQKDREAMRRKAQDQARKQGKSYSDIMVRQTGFDSVSSVRWEWRVEKHRGH